MISIVLPTARPLFGTMIGREKESWLDVTLASLRKNWKTSENFELIIVDSCSSIRDLSQEFNPQPFPVKIVGHSSYWLDHGMWALRNANNAGIRASAGDYILFVNDCCEFPPTVLDRLHKCADDGIFMQLLYVYKMGNLLRKRLPNAPDHPNIGSAIEAGDWNDSNYVRGSLWRYMGGDPCWKEDEPPFRTGPGMIYAYVLFPTEDLYAINGCDENSDGDKAYDDFDVPNRLDMAGLLNSYTSPDFYIYENTHNSIDLGIFSWDTQNPVRCNRCLFEKLRQLGIDKANSYKLSEDDYIQIMKGHVWAIRENCDHPYQYNPELPVWKHQQHWMKNPPVFDL